MNFTAFKSGLVLSAATVGAFSATPAMAQASEESGGSDIIVTARRVEERLQDVPISITVYNQEQLTTRNIVSPSDLASYTPSLNTNQRFGPEKSSYIIRGFTQDSGTSPSVGVYFADVVGPRGSGGTTTGNGATPGALFDLQNIQVLKGPQGTLFGRNTTGGAVLLVPQKPTDKLEGYVSGELGGYNLKRVQAVLNVPLGDTIRIRAGIDRYKRDGYIHNLSGIGPKDYNNVNYFAARLSVVADLTPDIENYTVGTFNHSFGHGYGARIIAACREGFLIPARGSTPYAACNQFNRSAGRSLLDVEISNPDPFIDQRQWQAINTTTWKASDTLELKNIISYGEFRERSSLSLNSDNFTWPSPPVAANSPFVGRTFFSTVLNPSPDGFASHQSTFTEEFRIHGNSADDRFDWQVGAYLEISKPKGFSENFTAIGLSCLSITLLQCNSPTTSTVSVSSTKLAFNNKGLYAQANYKLTEQLTVTGGIRYTIDKTKGIGESNRYLFGTDPNVYTPVLRICSDPRINTGPGSITSPTQCHNEISIKSEKPTWLISLDYKLTNDVMVFAKYSRGYRQGLMNMNAISLETWGPEKLDTYEIGMKSSFRGAVPGYFNITGFYNKFDNQQIAATVSGKNPGPFANSGIAVVLNAGKSRIWGIEVEGGATLFDSLHLEAGYAYLDTQLQSINLPTLDPLVAQIFNPPTSTAEVGKVLAYSPKHRLTATATYTLPFDESVGKVSLGATFVYTSSQVSTACRNSAGVVINPFCLLPSTSLLNLNVDWKGVGGSPVDAGFFVTNVTNKIYPVATGGLWPASGFETQLYGQPRMWGFRLKYHFGD